MLKILVVEDNEMNRDIVARRLSGIGYSLVVANDGERGYVLAQEERPDLIVMDLALPGMDGLEVTRLLRSNEQTRAIPIILLTAHASLDTRAEAFAAGCNDYAVKPMAFSKLCEHIERLLVRRDESPLTASPSPLE